MTPQIFTAENHTAHIMPRGIMSKVWAWVFSRAPESEGSELAGPAGGGEVAENFFLNKVTF